MSEAMFPRTTVGGVSLPRMLIGSNWMLGYSHTSSAADKLIKDTNLNREAIANLVEVFMRKGVDAIMGVFTGFPQVIEGFREAEQRVGRKLIIIDTPNINVDDTAEGRREAETVIKACKAEGATFCFPHHVAVERLVNKLDHTMDRLPDYLSMIRDNGMIPGLSAHMPEVIIFADEQGYDVETYIQIYNCMGFLMQVEIEYIHRVIHNAKKPVMTIKPMAAGRCTPFVGLTFSFSTIRPCDMVTVGCFTPQEAAEDIEIGMAAIERRPPDLSGRASPAQSAIIQK